MSSLREFLTGIANAIRTKKGTTEPINAQNFKSEIESIQSGGMQVEEVENFPTENIDNTKIYSNTNPINVNVYYLDSYDTIIPLKNVISSELKVIPNITYYVVDSLPTTPNITDLVTFSNIYVYIYNNIPYVYGNLGSGNTWILLSYLFQVLGTGGTDRGYIENPCFVYEEGIYVSYDNKNYGVSYDKSTYTYDSYNDIWINYERVFYELLAKSIITFYCPSLMKIIPEYTFYQCRYLEKVNKLDNIVRIGDNAFSSCISLTDISLPNCTTVGDNAFSSCISLTDISLPNCTTVGNDAFYSCRSLTNITLPNCTTVGDNAFYSCSLTDISLPNCNSLGSAVFNSCSNLTSINFPLVSNLKSFTFAYCSALTNIYLGYEGIVSLSNTNAFNSGANNTVVHVRSAYADQYTTATNWSSLIASGRITIVGDYSD